MAKILVVDDHLSFRTVLAETLVGLKHQVVEAGTGAEGLQLLASAQPEIVFLDLRMPDLSGLDCLREIRKNSAFNNLPIIILTAYADSTNTIEAMKLGAFDHLTKPIAREDLKQVIGRALKSCPPPDLLTVSEKVLDSNRLIGESAAFREVEKLIGMALTAQSPIMILGEAGSGKEKIARTIYEHSDLSKPFMSISCSAPNEALEKWNDQGMVFLKEISDLDAANQAKLLTLIQTAPNPRVITGSSLDLDSLIKSGKLREDLYYRLSVFLIRVPPLRKRASDVLILAEEFLSQTNPVNPQRLTPAAAKALLEYDWPGNVRELLNIIQRASILARGNVIDVENITFPHQATLVEATLIDLLHLDYYSAIGRLEKMLLTKALKDASGNRTEAARTLGINRQLLYAKLKEHTID